MTNMNTNLDNGAYLSMNGGCQWQIIDDLVLTGRRVHHRHVEHDAYGHAVPTFAVTASINYM